MFLKCLEGMYLTYTSEIFPDRRRKKQIFAEQCLGLFLAELGLFCHFLPGLLAIVLGSKPSPVTRIAGIGLGTWLSQDICYARMTRNEMDFGLRNSFPSYFYRRYYYLCLQLKCSWNDQRVCFFPPWRIHQLVVSISSKTAIFHMFKYSNIKRPLKLLRANKTPQICAIPFV